MLLPNTKDPPPSPSIIDYKIFIHITVKCKLKCELVEAGCPIQPDVFSARITEANNGTKRKAKTLKQRISSAFVFLMLESNERGVCVKRIDKNDVRGHARGSICALTTL